MEKLCLTGAKMLERVDVPIVHIEESVCGKLKIQYSSALQWTTLWLLYRAEIGHISDKLLGEWQSEIGMGQDSERESPGQSCLSWRDLTMMLQYPTCLARHLDMRKLQETDRRCDERNHYSWHFSRNYSIDSLMNREPATETMCKWLASTKKVQIMHDVDDADVSIVEGLI